MPQNNSPRRPTKPSAPPPSLTDEVSRLAQALEEATDPGRAQRATAARVDDLASQVRRVRAAQLRARRDAVNDRIDTVRQARRDALRARLDAVTAAAPAPTAAKTTATRRASLKPPARAQTRRGTGR
ncbi:hypothetical protein [Frankia sp. ACN1ag]|uniref:hypothetical protein n=1 Tax=Frankia sp. ACN1ag TaxID=102891 RepID=UPI00128F1493|nr:hypothetical protein [Frankia sp. ACN1ag]